MKTLEKFSKLSHSKILGILTLFLIISFILASLLNWETIKIIIGITTIWILIVLLLAYLLEEYKDETPLPLTDLRLLDKPVQVNRVKLISQYENEMKRSMPRSMYLLALPDELQYIEWLELQATKLQVLKDNGEK